MKKAKRKSKRKSVAVPAIIDANQRYTIPEASAILRQCHVKTYRQISEGTLQPIRDDGRVYIPGSELIRRSTLPDQRVQTPAAS